MKTPFRPVIDVSTINALIGLFHALQLDGEWTRLYPDQQSRIEVMDAMRYLEEKYEIYKAREAVKERWEQ